MSTVTLPQGRHGLVLADPAWAFVGFNSVGTPHRTAEDHYPVMSLDDMKALPVRDVVADDAVLIMWTIGSHLDQALELGRAWGFTYKTDVFVWVKVGKHDPKVRPISMGKWSRKQTETALLFSRGKPKRLDAGVRQLFESDEHVIYAPKREHSRKPDEQYERIERLTAGPYLELFARTQRPGWSTWGNETAKFQQIDPLQNRNFPTAPESCTVRTQREQKDSMPDFSALIGGVPPSHEFHQLIG